MCGERVRTVLCAITNPRWISCHEWCDWRLSGVGEKPAVPKGVWSILPFCVHLNRDLYLMHGSVEKGCDKDNSGNLAHYMVKQTQ